MADTQTLDVYDGKIDDYLRLTQAPPSKALLAFIKAIPAGGRVLDLGCGPGLAAAEMARRRLPCRGH
jgi:trans-aconitate methyltransferase